MAHPSPGPARSRRRPAFFLSLSPMWRGEKDEEDAGPIQDARVTSCTPTVP